jgi:hypothetical protein
MSVKQERKHNANLLRGVATPKQQWNQMFWWSKKIVCGIALPQRLRDLPATAGEIRDQSFQGSRD